MNVRNVNAETYRSLPQVPFAALTLLWYSDFWDGPLSGLLTWQSERLWFLCFEKSPATDGEPEPDSYRRFLIVRPTAQQLRNEEYWHDLFRRCVGTHTDYVDRAEDDPGTVRPRERWAEFYDAYAARVPPDFSANEAVAWFEM